MRGREARSTDCHVSVSVDATPIRVPRLGAILALGDVMPSLSMPGKDQELYGQKRDPRAFDDQPCASIVAVRHRPRAHLVRRELVRELVERVEVPNQVEPSIWVIGVVIQAE